LSLWVSFSCLEDENEAISFYSAMYEACVQLKKEGGQGNDLKAGYLMKV
jgi:hypothetical protein